MRVGSSFYSFLELFHLSPNNEPMHSDFDLVARHLHNMIRNYHSTMIKTINHMNSEIHALRLSVFESQRECVGALALGKYSFSCHLLPFRFF